MEIRDRIKQAIEQLDANKEAFSVEEVSMLRRMFVDYLEQVEAGTSLLPAAHVLLMNEIVRNEDGFKAACEGLLRFMYNCVEVACTKTNPDFVTKIRDSYYGKEVAHKIKDLDLLIRTSPSRMLYPLRLFINPYYLASLYPDFDVKEIDLDGKMTFTSEDFKILWWDRLKAPCECDQCKDADECQCGRCLQCVPCAASQKGSPFTDENHMRSYNLGPYYVFSMETKTIKVVDYRPMMRSSQWKRDFGEI